MATTILFSGLNKDGQPGIIPLELSRLSGETMRGILPCMSLNPTNKGFADAVNLLLKTLEKRSPNLGDPFEIIESDAVETEIDGAKVKTEKTSSHLITTLATLATLASLPITVKIRPDRGRKAGDKQDNTDDPFGA